MGAIVLVLTVQCCFVMVSSYIFIWLRSTWQIDTRKLLIKISITSCVQVSTAEHCNLQLIILFSNDLFTRNKTTQKTTYEVLTMIHACNLI